MTIEFKQVSDHLCKINIKADIDSLILDVYRNGKFLRTVNISAAGEQIS